jgi:hypothetical protein
MDTFNVLLSKTTNDHRALDDHTIAKSSDNMP